MITQTIREAIMDESAVSPGYVYVVRDGDVIFYVGLSSDPTFRLAQHVGIAGSHSGSAYYISSEEFIRTMEEGEMPRMGASSIGLCIIDNAPGSLSWSFDIYEKQDALAVLERSGDLQVFPALPGLMEHDWYNQSSLVESALIQELHPCLNKQNASYYDNPLPERYIKRKIVNLDVRITQ